MNFSHEFPTSLIAPFSVAGELKHATARSSFTGPLGGELLISRYFTRIHIDTIGNRYTFRDKFDLVSTVTAPCGEESILNINSELEVSNAANIAGSGYIANDAVRLVYFTCIILLKFPFAHRMIYISIRYALWYFFTRPDLNHHRHSLSNGLNVKQERDRLNSDDLAV